MNNYKSPGFAHIRLADPVLKKRLDVCIKSTIPAAVSKTIETNRINAFDIENYHGERHIYWDSDVAKVLEGIANALVLQPDEKLLSILTEWIDKIVACQQQDGYLNSYFSGENASDRWKNLRSWHELYCAGHLMEAAVAAKDLPGGKKLLDAMCRYADYICDTFGVGENQRRGWPGHEEIELALIRLYRATGKKRYLEQAQYFINDRGTLPNVFLEEDPGFTGMLINLQADKPVRKMTEAYGHAVRAVYLYAGMVDLASETNDSELLAVCEKIFDNIRTKRMYVTGGIGSSFKGETFTKDYDLANGSLMYAESCAAMGLVQLAYRLFNCTGKNIYLDVLETALYNSVPAGISLAGEEFFYTNYLEVDSNLQTYNYGSPVRQKWFSCSCCPTSFCRFLTQTGKFLYSVSEDEICVNIPAANSAEFSVGSQSVKLRIEGNYPYDGKIRIFIESDALFSLRLRIPGWCRSYQIKCAGIVYDNPVISRQWHAGDVVEFDLDMPIDTVFCNPKVTNNSGRIALRRGPVFYALEEIDQSAPVRELIIDTQDPMSLTSVAGLPEGTPAISGTAVREFFEGDDLYSVSAPQYQPIPFTAIPYALWQNRGPSNMSVWLRFFFGRKKSLAKKSE